jgi:hypothetical protein
MDLGEKEEYCMKSRSKLKERKKGKEGEKNCGKKESLKKLWKERIIER